MKIYKVLCLLKFLWVLGRMEATMGSKSWISKSVFFFLGFIMDRMGCIYASESESTPISKPTQVKDSYNPCDWFLECLWPCINPWKPCSLVNTKILRKPWFISQKESTMGFDASPHNYPVATGTPQSWEKSQNVYMYIYIYILGPSMVYNRYI